MTGGGFHIPDEDWDHGTIYTSPTSKILLLLRFPHLRPYVVELELHQVHTIRGRSIKLIEANHCPGAVMFLMKDEDNTTILHTGDFRFKPNMLKNFFKQPQ